MTKADGKFTISDIGVIFGIIAGIFTGVAYMVHETKVELKADIQSVSKDVKDINDKLDTMTCQTTMETNNAKIERMAEEKTDRENNTQDNRTKEDETKLFWKFRLGQSRSKGERYGVRP